jgi:hypothetical protein
LVWEIHSDDFILTQGAAVTQIFGGTPMKITAFIQVRNEVATGHLQRFFKWNLDLFDYIVAFDDASFDGSVEFLQPKVDLLIRSEFCSFSSELANKKRLLIEAKKSLPETNWFLWLDADEVL